MRHSPNPRKEAYLGAMEQIFDYGIVLDGSDIEQLAENYGYMPKTGLMTLKHHCDAGRLAEGGLNMAIQTYRMSRMYYDGSLPMDMIDFEAAKNQIDTARHANTDKGSLNGASCMPQPLTEEERRVPSYRWSTWV